MIAEGKIADTGVVCPEELPRSVQDAFCAECVKRNMPITRTDTAHIA